MMSNHWYVLQDSYDKTFRNNSKHRHNPPPTPRESIGSHDREFEVRASSIVRPMVYGENLIWNFISVRQEFGG